MSKLNIILVGASGKMGQEITALLAKHDKAKLLAGVNSNRFLELNWARRRGANVVVIDFSTPEGFSQALKFCVQNRIPFVSGTTGLRARHFNELKKAGRKIPALWSPNMSLGVNLLFNLIEKVGVTFSGFDMQIEESHHKNKVDSPSGTAIALQNKIQVATKKKLPPILSTRGGSVVGQHKLTLMGEDETITIEHSALNRRVFARGAVAVALWLAHKRSKLYDMKDFING